jgi:hypothetical protein
LFLRQLHAVNLRLQSFVQLAQPMRRHVRDNDAGDDFGAVLL